MTMFRWTCLGFGSENLATLSLERWLMGSTDQVVPGLLRGGCDTSSGRSGSDLGVMWCSGCDALSCTTHPWVVGMGWPECLIKHLPTWLQPHEKYLAGRVHVHCGAWAPGGWRAA